VVNLEFTPKKNVRGLAWPARPGCPPIGCTLYTEQCRGYRQSAETTSTLGPIHNTFRPIAPGGNPAVQRTWFGDFGASDGHQQRIDAGQRRHVAQDRRHAGRGRRQPAPAPPKRGHGRVDAAARGVGRRHGHRGRRRVTPGGGRRAEGDRGLGHSFVHSGEEGDQGIRRSRDQAIRRAGDQAIRQSGNQLIRQSSNQALMHASL
jgi:hypothetical protein